MTKNTELQQTLLSPSWREWLLLALRHRHLIRITGNSMQPTLLDGDVVIVNKRAYRDNMPSVGDIVLAKHPYKKNIQITKRVADITSENRIVLHSDNPSEGSDSRQFGTISTTRLLGQVTAHISQNK